MPITFRQYNGPTTTGYNFEIDTPHAGLRTITATQPNPGLPQATPLGYPSISFTAVSSPAAPQGAPFTNFNVRDTNVKIIAGAFYPRGNRDMIGEMGYFTWGASQSPTIPTYGANIRHTDFSSQTTITAGRWSPSMPGVYKPGRAASPTSIYTLAGGQSNLNTATSGVWKFPKSTTTVITLSPSTSASPVTFGTPVGNSSSARGGEYWSESVNGKYYQAGWPNPTISIYSAPYASDTNSASVGTISTPQWTTSFAGVSQVGSARDYSFHRWGMQPGNPYYPTTSPGTGREVFSRLPFAGYPYGPAYTVPDLNMMQGYGDTHHPYGGNHLVASTVENGYVWGGWYGPSSSPQPFNRQVRVHPWANFDLNYILLGDSNVKGIGGGNGNNEEEALYHAYGSSSGSPHPISTGYSFPFASTFPIATTVPTIDHWQQSNGSGHAHN